jgi:formate dehydrogenase major subunit
MGSEAAASTHTRQPTADFGGQALAAVDQVLRDRPNKIGHDFSAAVVGLSKLRDHVIAERRSDPTSQALLRRLGRLNSVLSVLVGAHYPLGHVPWDCLEKARGVLAELVAEEGSTSRANRADSSEFRPR